MKREEILNAVAAVLGRYRAEITAGYLFGSAAGREVGALSDIDVAVLASGQDETLGDLRFRIYADLCRALQRNDIDLVILNTASNMILKDEIVRNGILVHESDSEAREEFEVRVIHSCIDFRRQRQETIGV